MLFLFPNQIKQKRKKIEINVKYEAYETIKISIGNIDIFPIFL